MKIYWKLLCIIFILFQAAIPVFCQENNKNFSIESSISKTKLYSKENASEAGLSQSVYVKFDIISKRKIDITSGLGFFNIHFFRKRYSGLLDFPDIEDHYTYNYVAFPIGVKYYIGSFFIRPEMAFAYNVATTVRGKYFDIDMTKHSKPAERLSKSAFYSPSKVAVPAILTIGKSLNLGNGSLLLGVNGFTSIHTITRGYPGNHFIGFGFLAGYEF